MRDHGLCYIMYLLYYLLLFMYYIMFLLFYYNLAIFLLFPPKYPLPLYEIHFSCYVFLSLNKITRGSVQSKQI